MHCASSRLSIVALLIAMAPAAARADLVIVETVPLYASAGAGLEVGDRVSEWRQSDSDTGSLDDPLTLQLVEIERMPLGPLTLIGERDGKLHRWDLPATRWGLRCEPGSGESAETRSRAWVSLNRAKQQLQAGEEVAAAESFALAIAEAGDPASSAVLRISWSEALDKGGDRAAARANLEAGLDELRSSGADRPLLEAEVLERLGVAARRLRDVDAAETHFNTALRIRRDLAPGGVVEAETLYDLHLCAFSRGDLSLASDLGSRALLIYEALPASEYILAKATNDIGRVSLMLGEYALARTQFESALKVFRQVDPRAADVGNATTNLGILERRSGDLALAAERFEAALSIYETLEPGGPAVAMLMNNLGAVAFDRGDLYAAEHYIGRALELQEHRDPSSMAVAMYLNNVASMALERGDLAKAEQLYLRALSIRDALAPKSLDTALSNENLGSVCFERGDLDRSHRYFEQALAMVRGVAPGSSDEARILRNMGQLASRRGDSALALELLERSLEIRSRISPGSLDHASSLSGLANVNRELGNYETATEQLRSAIAMVGEVAPQGLTMATYYSLLSTLQLETGDTASALEFASRSLDLRHALIGGSYLEAVSWNKVGKARRAAGETEQALAAFVAATELMDQQGSSVGSIEDSRMSFRANHADIYRNCVDARIARNDREGAAEDLERSRAQSFLTMLGQRDLQYSADLPDDVLARRRRNRTEYDRTLGELARLSPADQSVMGDSLSRILEGLAEERGHIAAEVKRLAPQLDALERPPLLSAREILDRIPAGTVFIAYSVGPQRTHGLVMRGSQGGGHGEISHFTVEIDRHELESAVRRLRTTIQERGKYAADSVALYRLLVQPAEDTIERGERLLLSPDGPLHLLPFAALLVPREDGRREFLTHWRPLHFTSSVAVYAEERGQTRPRPNGQIVVFADPEVSREDSSAGLQPMQVAMGAAHSRGLVGGARNLGQLEYARDEAAAIESLYGASRTTVYLGGAASEERAKSLVGKFSFIHFACHGVADQADPLNSALILSEVSDESSRLENGILQSWEVLESVRFDAELVTLSACETALGADMGGEGIVSLVRSFQYAGANSVLASLWQVADRPTADLMKHFYAGVEQGRPKDEALRAAQLMAIESGRAEGGVSSSRGVGGLADVNGESAHPFYWAAFQLYGNPAPGS